MIEDFLDHLRRRPYSKSTVAISKQWLEHFLSRYPGPPKDLKPTDLTRYHQSLQWEPGPSGKLYSENTVNQALGVLRSYFRWCIGQGHLKVCPAAHLLTRRVPPKERSYLTPEQIRTILALPDLTTPLGLRDRAALGLMVEVQASPSSLSRLNLADFQPDTGALLLQARKRRIISLASGLQADLERYLRLGRQGYVQPDEDALFLNHRGSRLSVASLRMMLKSYCQRAQLPQPHLFS